MFKKMLKRAVAEAMGQGYRSGKPWKKGKVRSDWRGPGYGGPSRYDGYGHGPYGPDPYRHDPYARGGYNGYGPRHGGGIKGLLISAIMGWLSRRR